MTLLPPPLVPQFAAGLGPRVSDFTGWVTDTLGFQTTGIVFRATATIQQTIPSAGVPVIVFFDSVTEDPYGGWTGLSPPAGFPDEAWIAPYTGFLEAEMFCSVTTSAVNMQATILVTGSAAYTATQAELSSAVVGGGSSFLRVPVVGGQDYIQAQVTLSTSSNTTDVSTFGRQPELTVSYISQ